MEASAEGAKQSESPDSTKGLSEHMFGEQVFVLGQPNSVTKVTGVVTKVTSFGLDKGN